jgi:hypothetical protein
VICGVLERDCTVIAPKLSPILPRRCRAARLRTRTPSVVIRHDHAFTNDRSCDRLHDSRRRPGRYRCCGVHPRTADQADSSRIPAQQIARQTTRCGRSTGPTASNQCPAARRPRASPSLQAPQLHYPHSAKHPAASFNPASVRSRSRQSARLLPATGPHRTLKIPNQFLSDSWTVSLWRDDRCGARHYETISGIGSKIFCPAAKAISVRQRQTIDCLLKRFSIDIGPAFPGAICPSVLVIGRLLAARTYLKIAEIMHEL